MLYKAVRNFKATGGNHFEYSEEHVAIHSTVVTYQEYSDGIGPSPKGGGAEPARPPSKSAYALHVLVKVGRQHLFGGANVQPSY